MVATVSSPTCTLCGLPAPQTLRNDAGDVFCCPACREVHSLTRSGAAAEAPPAAEPVTATATLNLSLGGLWCVSCGWLIGETLARAPGVAGADVSFVRRTAQVHYDADRIQPDQLVKRVRRLGYRAWTGDEETGADEEERHFSRLLIGLVLAMHVMLISIFLYIRQFNGAPPETQWLADFFHIILLVGSTPMMILFGLPILRAGLASVFSRRPNMHALIALGAFSAYGLSLRNFIVGSGHLYFDTASMLLFLVAIGRWLEIRAHKTSSEAVERLWEQVPRQATWLSPAGEQQVPVEDLPIGARVLVRPGESVPVDGIIAAGSGDVDESLLTGESLPVLRREGDRLLAGTLSVDGAFEVVTTATGVETTAGQIGRLLHEALWARAPIHQLADKLAGWMVPGAVLIAAATFAFWSLTVNVEQGLLNALSVLLIACPCALGLATPLTLWHGVSRAAQGGVILRGSSALEHLANARTVFFDKTGTLTYRSFQLAALWAADTDEDTLLARAAVVEAHSEHPLGRAIADAAKDAAASLYVKDFRALPGYGVEAICAGERTLIGNRHLLAAHDIPIPAAGRTRAAELETQGLTVIYVAWGGALRGLIGLGERVRPDASELVADLHERGLNVALLTGDTEQAGRRWAERLGIPVLADLRPEDKIAHIKAQSGPLVMVGDGINDGPALAAADVGIAVSDGTDVARAAAEAILINDNLRAVPWLLDLGAESMRRVRQNLMWALVYNLIGLGLAASGLLWPVLSALAMVLSSIIVTANAGRLRRFPLGQAEPTAVQQAEHLEISQPHHV